MEVVQQGNYELVVFCDSEAKKPRASARIVQRCQDGALWLLHVDSISLRNSISPRPFLEDVPFPENRVKLLR